MLFLSIGENCMPGIILKRFNINSWNTPFTYARTNICYAIECENTNYKELLKKENIVKDESSPFPDMLRNKNFSACETGLFDITVSNGFEFTHHNVFNNVAHIESYNRKIERMLQLRDSNDDVLFFYHHRKTAKNNINKILYYCNKYSEIYARKDRLAKIIIMNQNIVSNDVERHVQFYITKNVILANFYTLQIWGGNNREVLSAQVDNDLFIKMFVKLYDLHILNDLYFINNIIK